MPRPPAGAGRPRASHDVRARARRGLATGRVVLGLAGICGAGACGGDDAKADPGSDASSGTTGEAPLTPTFVEPASGMLRLDTTRTEDLVLAVGGITPGLTEVLIDGASLGPLDADARAGRFDEGSLVLHVRGAMIEGMHRMTLRTIDPAGTLISDPVAVTVVSEQEVEPMVAPPRATGRPGDRLLAMGEGADALLVVLDAQGPWLHLVPRGETGWDVDGVRTVAAPGFSPTADARVLPVAALRHGRSGDDPGRVRVAYRADDHIALLDVPWDAATPEAEAEAALTLQAALAGPAGGAAEWAELGRPWLVGDLLVAELWAPVDTESPRPGDRALVWSRVRDPLTLDAPQRVSLRADLVDLDRLGPALDPVATAAGGPSILSIRVDRHQPLVLAPDPTGGLRSRPTVLDGTDRSFSHVDLPLATVVGAFGSRTVAGLATTSSGRMRVAAIDDIGDAGLRDTSLSDDQLPPFDQVTGELWPAVVAGAVVYLVPYGPELPVHAVHTTGDAVRVAPQPELRCDAIALAPSPDPSGEVPLGCTVDGELWLGSLNAVPAP